MIKTLTIVQYCDGWQVNTYSVTEDEQHYICPSYGKIKIPDELKGKIVKN